MAVKLQIRRGNGSDWTSTNPTLAEGELAVELDNKRFKIGDGSTSWTSLGYATGPRISSTSSTATLSWNSNSYDTIIVTAQSGGLTISADSGSPYNGQRALFSITTSSGGGLFSMTQGSAKAFRLVGVSLPSTLTTNNTLYLGCIYNSAAGSGTGRWDVISIREGA